MIQIKKKANNGPEVAKTSDKPEPRYPYGTSMTLPKEITQQLPALVSGSVGQKVKLVADAFIRRKEVRESEDGGDRYDVELQFTGIEVQAGAAKRGSTEQLDEIVERHKNKVEDEE